jgi:hypothetical protein
MMVAFVIQSLFFLFRELDLEHGFPRALPVSKEVMRQGNMILYFGPWRKLQFVTAPSLVAWKED